MKIKKLEKVHITYVIGIVLLISLVLFFHFRNDEIVEVDWMQAADEEEEKEVKEEFHIEKTVLVVDIKGEVANPGVYELKEGSRMYEAIERAGGLLDTADENQLNLAQLLQDEMMIYVPAEGEEVTVSEQHGGKADDGKIAINQAAESELEQLPGIGPAKAQAILSYREEHGDFQQVEDLLNVPGIGQKSLEKLRDHILIK